MNGWVKLGIGAWLAQGLAAAALGVAAWLGASMFMAGLAADLALAFLALALGLAGGVRRWLARRFSPVRRKGPRPPAWHQWR